MEKIGNMDFEPWFIIRELDELSSSDEKISFSKGNSTMYNNYNNFINNNNLIDLGFLGNRYTWHNRRKDPIAIFSRLDRVMANRY